jgi:hypothetical protein
MAALTITTLMLFGSRIISPIIHSDVIALMTHDGEASVNMIHPHFNSAGKKVSSLLSCMSRQVCPGKSASPPRWSCIKEGGRGSWQDENVVIDVQMDERVPIVLLEVPGLGQEVQCDG